MKKFFLALFSVSILLLQNCTNSTDEDPDPISITVEDFTATVDENPVEGSVVGTINASVNEGTLSYALGSQNPPNALAISEEGQLTVNDARAFDFEVNPAITTTVEVTSANVTGVANVTINLNDVAEGTDGLTVNNFSINFFENPANGAEIGTISASSTQGTLQFVLVSQSPVGAIGLDQRTGVLTVADASLFTIAGNPVITATIEVSDGTDAASISVTINLQLARVIWTGEKIIFTKRAGANPNAEANQDRITDNVWITRGNSGGPIFNVQSSSNNDDGPGDTEWALGTTAQIDELQFSSLRDAVGGARRAFRNLIGRDMVLHLITDDIYIDIKFSQWSQGSEGQRGGFSYERSTEQ